MTSQSLDESDDVLEQVESESGPTDVELRARCTRFLMGRGWPAPAKHLEDIASLGDELSADMYGDGGAVAVLESRVQELLGKPAVAFMPSGTMAQQIAMRIHAQRSGRSIVAFHPSCHLELHEGKGYQRLHGLVGRPVGDPHELFTLEDLRAVHEPLAAVIFELPQREIGGLLPTWEDLRAQVAAVREMGAAVHLDGARLWECTPHFGKDLHEIAALFDSVYVSFYKGLGGLAGCCLAGDADLIAEAREWRRRHGGTLFAMWPYAAAGLVGLRDRLPQMARYVDHARAIATALQAVDGVEVRPDPPQTPMMHLLVRTSAETWRDGALRLVHEQQLWIGLHSASTGLPGWRRIELTVGDATLDFRPAEVRDLIASCLTSSSRSGEAAGD